MLTQKSTCESYMKKSYQFRIYPNKNQEMDQLL
ncbi:MAG: helix-turn-helix domain-containing protein [Euryarchaeota archaeon]|nr:helix-turn-helix domain-containing protein [Euryarchaeota archaeon]